MKFNSNGKLMLTGEYLALDNALVLTLPTKFGQSLDIKEHQGEGLINWKSYTNENHIWFSAQLSIGENSFQVLSDSDEKITKTLIKILTSANNLSQTKLSQKLNFDISTKLEFPQNWGLGSSSTLINNIAQWFHIDPFKLHFSIFNGSGYDIAAASANSAVTYRINNKKPIIKTESFNPIYKDKIFFVHLNQKQNSYDEVKKYQDNKDQIKIDVAVLAINNITAQLINSSTIHQFEQLMIQHEDTVASILGVKTIKSKLFPDYKDGIIKSLGAWGGDFILVTGNDESSNYFEKKGFHTILKFSDMII